MARFQPMRFDSYVPLREQVFETIRDAILSGRLAPGERITENQIAAELNVSRTPVREAIRKLELEGLVAIVPRRGVYVGGVSSIRDVLEVFEIRSVLEGLAAGLAAMRITTDRIDELHRLTGRIASCIDRADLDLCIVLDHDFHQVIYQASGNSRLNAILYNLREQIEKFRAASLSRDGRMAEALTEHRDICRAIAAGESAAAGRRAITHIENARDSILNVLRDRQGRGQSGIGGDGG